MSQSFERLILERALKILDAGWTCHTLARDKTGRAVSPISAAAVAFCGQGALLRAAHELGLDEHRLFQSEEFFHNLPEINDTLGRAAVNEMIQHRLDLI